MDCSQQSAGAARFGSYSLPDKFRKDTAELQLYLCSLHPVSDESETLKS